jgi:hypothetical protein
MYNLNVLRKTMLTLADVYKDDKYMFNFVDDIMNIMLLKSIKFKAHTFKEILKYFDWGKP